MTAPADDFDPETRHRLQALSDALSDVQQQFAEGEPPIRSWHASGPYRGPALRTGSMRVWFLVDDEAAVTRGAELLPQLERATAEALARRDHLEAALAPLTIALDVLAAHAACRVPPRDDADQAARPTS